MLQMSGLDIKTSVHNLQYVEDVGNMTCIKSAKETTNVPPAKETSAGFKDCEIWKKKKLPD